MKLFASHPSKMLRLIAALCLLAQVQAAAQTVENVRTHFDQSKLLLYITYDLKGMNYKREVLVTPYIVSDDPALPPMQSLSGDFGWIRSGGKNKVIVWDPFKDGLFSLKDVQVHLKTEVRNIEQPGIWVAGWQGSNSAPLGVKVMYLNRIGYYAGLRVGNLPPDYIYTVNNSGFMQDQAAFYTFGNERILAGYAITSGIIFQLSRNMYVCAGLGYGLEQLFWKYRDNDGVLINDRWTLNETIDRKGVVVEVQGMARYRRMLFSLGISTIQSKTFQETGGVGVQIAGGIGYVLSKNL